MAKVEIAFCGKYLLGDQILSAFSHEQVNAVLFSSARNIPASICRIAPIVVWDTNKREIILNAFQLKAKGGRLYRYWIGGDVLNLTKMRKDKAIINAWMNRFLFNKHFSTSQWLSEELDLFGIKSMPIPFSPLCCPEHHPMTESPPKPLKIVYYSIEGCDHIYQPIFLKQCADMLPHVEFICCGNNKLSISGNNIHNIGMIDNDKMREIYISSHCLFRVTSHDGFSRSIMEALSHGLYVVTNQPVPHTEQIDNFQTAVAAIRRIGELNERNYLARKWVFENFSSKSFVNNIMRLTAC